MLRYLLLLLLEVIFRKKYRDDLRDITDNLTDLEHVEWPRKPHYPEEFFNETFK